MPDAILNPRWLVPMRLTAWIDRATAWIDRAKPRSILCWTSPHHRGLSLQKKDMTIFQVCFIICVGSST
jgi:hypothetical protein